jgi:hypothetical protein
MHRGMEVTGSAGLIIIICHQVLHHLSNHGQHSMGKHLPAKAHITKSNKVTQSKVTELTSSKVDETALAILQRRRCQSITIVKPAKVLPCSPTSCLILYIFQSYFNTLVNLQSI